MADTMNDWSGLLAYSLSAGDRVLAARAQEQRKQLGQFLTPPMIARYMARPPLPQNDIFERDDGLLRRIFEVDPLLCSCGAIMKTVAIITDYQTVTRILEHIRSKRPASHSQALARAPC